MSDVSDALLELRDVGISQLPEAGDAGDRRMRSALDREIADGRPARFGWLRSRIAIGGFGVPVVLLGLVATAAAATGALVAVNATAIFQNNPQAAIARHAGVPARAVAKESVIPGSVREIASATVPHYGNVQFWGGVTQQNGFCFVIKLPDGSWGDYPVSRHPTGGWVSGTLPGCVQTQQQQVIGGGSVQPTAVEYTDNEVKTSTGHVWELLVGFVTVNGDAVTVKDPASGHTAAVTPDGYFLLAEPPSSGDDSANLQVLNAAGQPLKPDYTSGGMLPGYTLGPSQS